MTQGKICQRKSSGEISTYELEMKEMVAWLLSRSPPGEHSVDVHLIVWGCIVNSITVKTWNMELGSPIKQSLCSGGAVAAASS